MDVSLHQYITKTRDITWNEGGCSVNLGEPHSVHEEKGKWLELHFQCSVPTAHTLPVPHLLYLADCCL